MGKKKSKKSKHERTVEDIYLAMTEEQRMVLKFFVGKAIEDTRAECREKWLRGERW